jgi:DNA-binding winged helix-turn-helix (wHTH) protein
LRNTRCSKDRMRPPIWTHQEPTEPADEAAVYARGAYLDCPRRRVACSSKELDVSPREFDLLCELVRHEGEVVDRVRLARVIWHREPDAVLGQIIDAHIARISRKLERAGGRPLFRSLRGKGYRLQASLLATSRCSGCDRPEEHSPCHREDGRNPDRMILIGEPRDRGSQTERENTASDFDSPSAAGGRTNRGRNAGGG